MCNRKILYNVICFFIFTFLSVQAASARNVYVCLNQGASQFSVASDANLFVTGKDQKQHTITSSAVFRRSGDKLISGKQSWSLPVQISGGGLLRYNNKSYRGQFLVSSKGLLINIVDLEDYLQGVLPSEIGAKWPIEAQKVQAIISRTYALRQSFNRAARGYDVLDTVSDQVYKGAGVESAISNKAVRETTGQVLAYGSDLAFTPFHSDSGGHTANNEEVWGKNLPYLKGVAEPIAYESPNSSWSVRIPARQVESAIAKIGGNVGKIREIRIAEVGAGGRAASLKFSGSSGAVSLRSSIFRMAIGPNILKSTMLTTGTGGIKSPVPAVQIKELMNDTSESIAESEWKPEDSGSTAQELSKIPVPTSDTPMSPAQEARLTKLVSDGVFNSAELMDMLKNPAKRKGYLYMGIQRGGSKVPNPNSKSPVKKPLVQNQPITLPVGGGVIPFENGMFVFQGRGWGHGVGLSQWGMLALATKGWTAERILTHYYPGTAVKKFK